MDLAVRPRITVGLALAGVGIITLNPLGARLPEVQVAQHLPQVHLSDVRLANVDGFTDLFSGVEGDLASLAGGVAAAGVPANLLVAGAFPGWPSWLDVFTTAGNNVETLANNWLAEPFPVLQQLITNQIGYGQTVATSVQSAATSFLNFVTGSGASDLPALFANAIQAINGGNIEGATSIFQEIVVTLMLDPLEQLYPAIQIPATMSQNFADVVSALTGPATLLPVFEASLGPWLSATTDLGDVLQYVDGFWHAGQPLEALTALVNGPALVANGFLNGVTLQFPPGEPPGLLSEAGPIGTLLITLPQQIAQALGDGPQSLAAAAGLAGPSIAGDLGGLAVSLDLTGLLHGLDPSILTDLAGILPSVLPEAASTLSTNLGTLAFDLLALL